VYCVIRFFTIGLKGKVYKTMVNCATLCGSECWAVDVKMGMTEKD